MAIAILNVVIVRLWLFSEMSIDDENATLPSEYLKNISKIVVEMSEKRFKSIVKILPNATKFSTTKQQIIDY